MIGIIGPRDSVDLVDRISRELGIQDELVKRVYADPAEAPALAREIDDLCAVTLFTGRVPYALAASAGDYNSRLDFIPHEGTDLYRALVQLLREHPGPKMPRISLDSMDSDLVHEIIADVGINPKSVHVIPLNILDWHGRVPTAPLVKAHVDLVKRGQIDICVTCMHSIHARLKRLGVPVMQLTHSSVTVRQALSRSLLASQLHRAESSQTAACLLELRTPTEGGSTRRVSRHLSASVAARYASRLGGAIRQLSKDQWVVHTTRGAVAQWADDQSETRWQSEGVELSHLFSLGIGIGSTVGVAEEAARTALTYSRRDTVAYICQPDGSVFAVGGRTEAYRSRVPQTTASRSNGLALTDYSLQKLRRSLKQLPSASSFSAVELAHVSGMSARTTRRMLISLLDSGIAKQVGRAQGGGPGRPTALYSIDPTLLVEAVGASK